MTTSPWLTIVLPTSGRRAQLFQCLEAIRQQPHDDVETLFVLDTHLPSSTARLDGLHAAVEELRMGIRWLEHDGGVNCYGQPQRTHGARVARGDWVAFTQDDNILAQGAIATIRQAIDAQDHPHPLFFRVLTPWRQLVWETAAVALGNIDADCLVLPRAIAQQTLWGLRYEGDYDAAVEVQRLSAGDIDWRPETIAIARPDPEHVWWTQEEHAA